MKVVDAVEHKVLAFGATGYEHYTNGSGHRGRLDKDRRDNYEQRHRTVGYFKGKMTPSSWAYSFVWLKPTLKEGVDDMKKES